MTTEQKLPSLNDVFGCIKNTSLEGYICSKCNRNHTISQEFLTQLGIRCWKHYKKFYDKSMSTNNFHSFPNAGEAMCTMDFIKNFFNLEKGDLK